MSDKFIITKKIKSFDDIEIPAGTTSIVCTDNELESLSGLTHLQKLESLDVSYNKLTDLKYLPLSVVNLRCSRNKITNLLDIQNNSNLRNLGISYNHLHTFLGCPENLEKIIAVSNFIETLCGLEKLKKLQILYVSYNRLQSLHYCPNVSVLDCSCNKIQELKEICYHDNISELICSYNELKTLSWLPKNVKILRCSGNKKLNTLAWFDYSKIELLECGNCDDNLYIDRDIMAKIPEIFSDTIFKT